MMGLDFNADTAPGFATTGDPAAPHSTSNAARTAATIAATEWTSGGVPATVAAGGESLVITWTVGGVGTVAATMTDDEIIGAIMSGGTAALLGAVAQWLTDAAHAVYFAVSDTVPRAARLVDPRGLTDEAQYLDLDDEERERVTAAPMARRIEALEDALDDDDFWPIHDAAQADAVRALARGD